MKKENSTHSLNGKVINDSCTTAVALSLISGRWKLNILWELVEGDARFSDIRGKIPNISERMLALQLKALEKDGLVFRSVFAEVPPRVEYGLTPLGRTMEPMLRSISDWGEEYAKKLGGVIADSPNLSIFEKP